MAMRRFLTNHKRTTQMMAKHMMEPCDVFLNHRSTDTKRTLATLLYDHLKRQGFNPFLDEKNMKPGDKLFEKINRGVLECKIGVAVFSPRYCESYFCLHELALLMACKKKVIPIFCDVKPSQLHVVNNANWSLEELRRFKWALEEAKYTVGLTFNSSKGNFSEIVTNASDIIHGSMIELQNEEQKKHKHLPIPA
uniref:TIR domain-containing protein n=2 Tax=Cicer arietinum TaxID=3827 RepID=A0A1S2XGN9_CICAR|nr:TIR domain-containing protein [Cicer arietinum]